LFLASCGGSAEPARDVNAMMTASIGTMVASFFGTQTAMYTPASPTSTVTQTRFPSPTPFAPLNGLSTSTPTWPFYTATLGTPRTPTITGTLPTATVNASALGYGCNNLAFVRDVNVPSGTVVKAGQDFTKTWKVENTGSCKWMFLYHVLFLSGTNFDPIYNNLGKLVEPGSWAEVSAVLSAPKKPGTYSAYFRFSDGSHMFGATLGVTIVVEADQANTSIPANTLVPTSTFTSIPSPSDTPIPSDTPVP
jgi:hypothetical protein